MMKQKDIANETGMSRSYICELVSTKKRPSYKTAKKLFRKTGVLPLVWLEGSSEEIRSALEKIVTTTNTNPNQIDLGEIDAL